MLGIIASNFLKIGNNWTIIEKYATTVVYVGTHFIPQFLENSRSHRNACNILIFSKNTQLLHRKGINDSTENISGITDGHQNNEKCECKVNNSDQCIKKEPESEN